MIRTVVRAGVELLAWSIVWFVVLVAPLTWIGFGPEVLPFTATSVVLGFFTWYVVVPPVRRQLAKRTA